MAEQSVSTPIGEARISWFQPPGESRAIVVLGHGSVIGIEAADLQAIAAALPPRDMTVALMTQPYQVSGSAEGRDEASLDLAWRAVWPQVGNSDLPVVAGGRSAGAQVACRTARSLGATAVLALSYPLLGPGNPGELLATGLPTLIVQGGSDPIGRPDQFPPLPPEFEMVEIPFANHTFEVPAESGVDAGAPLASVTGAVIRWLEDLLSGHD